MRFVTMFVVGIAACTVSAGGREATQTGNATLPGSAATSSLAASPGRVGRAIQDGHVDHDRGL